MASNHSRATSWVFVIFCLVGTAMFAQGGELTTPEGVRLLQNKSYDDSEEARAEYFVSRGYGSRATYFNHARVLRSAYSEEGAAVELRAGRPSLGIVG